MLTIKIMWYNNQYRIKIADKRCPHGSVGRAHPW